MVKTTVQYLCDACGKDVTKEYSGSVNLFISGDGAELIPDGKMFCRDCMTSFAMWMDSRKEYGKHITPNDIEFPKEDQMG